MEKCTLWSIIKVSTGECRVWKSIPFEGEWSLSKEGVKCYTDLVEVSNFAQFDKMVKGYLENYKHEENMGSIYTASEYKHPWVKSNGEICWDYRKGKHFDLFDTNLLIADYNFIKNLTLENVTIKCRNGVFILPPYGVMVTEYNKCLNNRVNSENYEIDLDEDVLALIPYFVKGDIMRLEDPNEAAEARNIFEGMCAEIYRGIDKPQAKVDTVFTQEC